MALVGGTSLEIGQNFAFWSKEEMAGAWLVIMWLNHVVNFLTECKMRQVAVVVVEKGKWKFLFHLSLC